jgi:hypothetical protein
MTLNAFGVTEDLAAEINSLLLQRAEHRQHQQWQQADCIKRKLWRPPYKVEIIDYADQPSAWRPRNDDDDVVRELSIEWSEMIGNPTSSIDSLGPPKSAIQFPLIIATVDNPEYRKRYQDTLEALKKWQTCSCPRSDKTKCQCLSFVPISCKMLDKNKEAVSIPVKKIVFEGWRRRLLPFLSGLKIDSTIDFLLVAEDDVRFPDHSTPIHVYRACKAAFVANPEILVLSLGHAWVST